MKPFCNFKNLDRTIAHLESIPDDSFHMRNSFCCIAGHILYEFCDIPYTCPIEFARDFLGISDDVADELFMNHYSSQGIYCDDVDRQHAIRMLKHFKKTGEVNWVVTANP